MKIKKNGSAAALALLFGLTMMPVPMQTQADDFSFEEENVVWDTAQSVADEEAVRIAAEEADQIAAEEAARIAAEEAARIAAEEEAARIAAEEAARIAAEEEARIAAEEAARIAAEEEASRIAAEEESRIAAEETARIAEEETFFAVSSIKAELYDLPAYTVVNKPFSVTLVLEGGTAPYTISVGDTEQPEVMDVPGEKTVKGVLKTCGKDQILTVTITDSEGEILVLESPLPVSDDTTADWEKIDEEMSELELCGDWAKDLVTVAKSQLGEKESADNFQIDEEGRLFGYTPYGRWQESDYGEWSAGFVDFCLHYADISPSDFPYESAADEWPEALQELYIPAESDVLPKTGDLIFLHVEAERIKETPSGEINHVGIVSAVSEDSLTVIEGCAEDSVKERIYRTDGSYGEDDETAEFEIIGFADMHKAQEVAREKEDETAGGDTSEDKSKDGGLNENTETESYVIEAEDLIFTVTPVDPDAIPEGTTAKIEVLSGDTVDEAADRLAETISDSDAKVEIHSVRSMRIVFLDAEGKEFLPSTGLKVTVARSDSNSEGQEEK